MGRALNRQRGVSLIEVLIAVLVFSLGLVGLASLMVVASQSNHSAYLRTQAGFLASSMANRMRANPVGVWNDAYNNDAGTPYPLTVTSPTCDVDSGCTPAQVATRDQAQWSAMLKAFLPGASATIDCDKSAVPNAPNTQQVLKRPPYAGSCLMRLTWNERGVGNAAGARDANAKTFDWVFQP